MESPVVLAMAKALDQRGIGSLRFNFRGVGESQGEFTNGQVEWRDVAAALEVLKRWPGIDRRRLAVAGYSFGALAVAKGAKEIKDAAVLVLVSPPLSAFAGSSIGQDKRPRLFLVGGRDRLVDAQALQNAVEGFSGLVEVEVTPGADHTWRGYEAALGDAVAAFASRHFW
ncbi:MAG: alpha/beta fold hydrolase [Chloroflexi bacterium]|nr:alpha/beta fold hydrolase [Chloroflexota bacterium]